nr:type ISP restriction/modification enzyme [Campylobacter troglodytis]
MNLASLKKKASCYKDKTSEQILAFIYANLYNPTYRKNFLEYLKIGFPRVNFEVSEKEFESFEKLGQRLIDLHLLKNIPKDESIKLEFSQEANKANPSFVLEKLSEKARFVNGKIILNKHLQIADIDENVWGYTVGGYQVLKQWLKYRVNKTLSKDELEHLVNICKIIKQSLILQNKPERLSENLTKP